MVITLVHEVQNCSMLDAVKERAAHENACKLPPLASEVDIQGWKKFARKTNKRAKNDLGVLQNNIYSELANTTICTRSTKDFDRMIL